MGLLEGKFEAALALMGALGVRAWETDSVALAQDETELVWLLVAPPVSVRENDTERLTVLVAHCEALGKDDAHTVGEREPKKERDARPLLDAVGTGVEEPARDCDCPRVGSVRVCELVGDCDR